MMVKISDNVGGIGQVVGWEPLIIRGQPPLEFYKVVQALIPVLGIHYWLNFILFASVNKDQVGVWVEQALWDGVWVVGADIGDGDDQGGFLTCRGRGRV